MSGLMFEKKSKFNIRECKLQTIHDGCNSCLGPPISWKLREGRSRLGRRRFLHFPRSRTFLHRFAHFCTAPNSTFEEFSVICKLLLKFLDFCRDLLNYSPIIMQNCIRIAHQYFQTRSSAEIPDICTKSVKFQWNSRQDKFENYLGVRCKGG